MSSAINLVTVDTKENAKRKKRTSLLRLISLIFLGFVGLTSIILFILNIRISVSSIKKDQAMTLQNITAEKNKVSKIYLLSDRLRNIREVIKSRKDYTSTLNVLLQQIPDGANATSVALDKGEVTLTVNSPSLLPINKFLNNILDLSSKKTVIKDMTIESLTINSKTRLYSLSIKAKI